MAVNGQLASERTSGTIPYAGTIVTNDSTLGAWQKIVDDNPGQATASTGNTALIADLTNQLNDAFAQIDGLAVSPGFANRSSTSLNGLNTENGVAETIVINVTSGFQVSSKINITGDAGDVFVLRWDTDSNFANGYQGQVKFQSGGAIVPLGGLTAGNFIHVAGNINASGGGGNPAAPFPQGPRLNDGTGALINGGKNFSGGGFFTGYWLTTGDPTSGDTSSLSNAIFVGGWYTMTDKFSMTSGTSGVHVSPNPATNPPPPTASLSGYVYEDVPVAEGFPGNGVFDAQDNVLNDVVITLYDANNHVVAQTTTVNGYYSFTGLAAGTYTIKESQPVPYLQGTNNLGSLGGTPGDDAFTVALGAGANGTDYDFGEVLNGPPI